MRQIAQRFNVGVGVTCGESPEGTADGFDMRCQSSLRDSIFIVTQSPKVETLGYFQGIPPGSKPIFNNPSGIKQNVMILGFKSGIGDFLFCHPSRIPPGLIFGFPNRLLRNKKFGLLHAYFVA